METSPAKKFKVLFLCTGKSARSILAEYFLHRLDPSLFEAYSAGTSPKGRIHPYVLEVRRLGLFTSLPIASLDRLRLEETTKAIGGK
jgi:hypothetical protein